MSGRPSDAVTLGHAFEIDAVDIEMDDTGSYECTPLFDKVQSDSEDKLSAEKNEGNRQWQK